ncbi:MAG: DUF5683 domain-containing protein [Bacteroidales bacterium]
MNKKIRILLFAMFYGTLIFAQKPKWIYNPPKSGNDTYRYEVEYGTDVTEDKARNKAFLGILQNASNSLGIRFDSKAVNDAILKGKDMETISVENDIPIHKVCEFVERIDYLYTVYILCQVAKKGNIEPIFDEFRACDKIGNNTPALWRSALVPGWGQFYNNKTGRGVAILASEAILFTTTIYSEMMRADNIRKSAETLNVNVIKEYRKRADTWEARRNIALGGTISVYAINLLDAALGKAKVKYAYIPDNIKLFASNEGNINQFGLRIKF